MHGAHVRPGLSTETGRLAMGWGTERPSPRTSCQRLEASMFPAQKLGPILGGFLVIWKA
jgi:hypothetical protein